MRLFLNKGLLPLIAIHCLFFLKYTTVESDLMVGINLSNDVSNEGFYFPKDTILSGIDVSKYQGEINWKLLKNDFQFAFCKATEGITYVDPRFEQNWKTLGTTKIIRGAYHFYRNSDDPLEQACFFTKIVDPYLVMDIPLVLDIEQGSLIKKITKKQLQKDLLVFLEEVSSNSNKTPIIYTDISFANTYLNNSKFLKYPLWIADYTTEKKPKLPKLWSQENWKFWQKSSHYRIDQIKSDLDYDLFNGDLNDLKNFIIKYSIDR